MLPTPLSWLEISRGALMANLGTLRRLLPPESRLAAVVKADAYGHGMALCADAFVRAGADMLCVNELAEAAALGDPGVAVYVLGPTRAEDAEQIVALGCEVVTASRDHADAVAAVARSAGRTIGLHVKFETGTHRQGLEPTEALALCSHIQATRGVRLAGVATHLSDVEEEGPHNFARVQIDRFEEATAGLPGEVLRHCAASAAHLLLPRARFGMVRVGIAAYGLWPSAQTRIACALVHGQDAITLVPALTWKTRVMQVRTVAAGGWVGYGRSTRLARESRIAVIPVGYWDGYDRGLSGSAFALVRGCPAPLAGRVCMNMAMLDVTDVTDAAVGDPVTLLGRDGDAEVSADDLARRAGTINYEITTRIHPRLPRLAVA